MASYCWQCDDGAIDFSQKSGRKMMPLEHHLLFLLNLVSCPHASCWGRDGIDDTNRRSVIIILLVGCLISPLLNILVKVASPDQSLDLALKLMAFLNVVVVVAVEVVVLPLVSYIQRRLHWLKSP